MVKMVNTSYANAYKEVLVVLSNLIEEDYEKIPKEYIEFLEANANSDYDFKYDSSKPFNNQKLLDETKYILFGLFEKYGATQNQKNKIKIFKDNYNRKLEQEKRKKYNPDDIFEKVDVNKSLENKENLQMIDSKKLKWYQKIFLKIFKKFKKI